jgi:hypothetical protein
VALHVLLRELDADGEDADREHDARELERDGVRRVWVAAAPGAGVEDAGAVRADDDAEDEGPDGLADVQLRTRVSACGGTAGGDARARG